jgi:chromosome segregation ATPase
MATRSPEYTRLANEVSDMRANGVRRHDASLYVCRKLMFEMGESPNAKLVREITQWGSVPDVANDVRGFFQSLKNPGGAPFAHTGLPVSLQTAYAQSLAELWAAARSEADAKFETSRAQFDEDRNAWKALERDLAGKIEAMEDERGTRRAALDEARDAATAMEQRIAGLEKERESLIARLDATQTELAQTLKDRSALQTELASEVENFGLALKLAEAEAEERRRPLLLELDATRQKVRSLEEAARQASSQLADAEKRNVEIAANGRNLETMIAARDQVLESRKAQGDAQDARIADLQEALLVANNALQQAQAREAAALEREAGTRNELRDAQALFASLHGAAPANATGRKSARGNAIASATGAPVKGAPTGRAPTKKK